MTSIEELHKIYEELILRIQCIGIGMHVQGRQRVKKIEKSYDLNRTDTPMVEETEDAFMKWNCAILTAFRGSETLSPEANFERNIKRNQELKGRMQEDGLSFRSVKGCYREANWEKPAEEICFFVTNTDEDAREFFCKVYRHAEFYEQDCFLFTFPGNNRVAFLVATNDDGRDYFRGDIKFAGPLFINVPDIGDWTDCSDGRISFRLKGMIQYGGTGDKKIKLGEGNIFDTDDYSADGIVIIRKDDMDELKDSCKKYDGSAVLEHRVFKQPTQSAERIHNVVMSALKVMKDNKCKRIGFHCSASVEGSSTRAAEVAMEAVIAWAKRYKKIEQIVIVDIYGDYGKIITNK